MSNKFQLTFTKDFLVVDKGLELEIVEDEGGVVAGRLDVAVIIINPSGNNSTTT
jgi:hypothetical protein